MQFDSDTTKSKALRWLEYVLLILCLCVLALRATYPENPHIIQLTTPNRILGNDGFSLIISTVLITAAVIWLLAIFFCRPSCYRFSGIEIGLACFLIAGFIGISAASNKRAAVTDMVTLVAPMLMALLLIQILDSSGKIRLVLFVIVSLGAAGSFQCLDQLLASNQYMIEDYEKDPADHLTRAGFEPNSFQHMLYEHRLYSKDIRGFFTTGNSAGSFAVLATFAAIGLLIEKFKNRTRESSHAPLVLCTTVAAVVITGLLITHSKGAIIASALSAGFLSVYLIFGGRLLAHRKTIITFCLTTVFAGLMFVLWYGISHGCLPGGNSMLVRWQYWTSAAKIYAEKPLTGVGGGNFATYYTHYKLPQALEAVRDPHNFVLTLLTQYGPLGLLGFVTAFGCVMYRQITKKPEINPHPSDQNSPSFMLPAGATLLAVLLTLLTLRPIVTADNFGDTLMVKVSVILTLYFIPAITFSIAFLLLWLADEKSQITNHHQENTTRAALFCGLVAVLIHNLIDFALFEPGVLTCFWAVIACLGACCFAGNESAATPGVSGTRLDSRHAGYKLFVFKPGFAAQITAVSVVVAVVWLYCGYALVPAVKASAKTQQAMGNLSRAANLLSQAAADDRLNPAPLNFAGRFYLQHYDKIGSGKSAVLTLAAQCFNAAVQRDKADFKNYEKLMTVYELLAAGSPSSQASTRMQKAYDMGLEAARRYPGKGTLQFELGKIAERLGNKKAALSHYKKAVQIEDSYRTQFRIMYPGREMFSRLGQKKYEFAKKQTSRLRE